MGWLDDVPSPDTFIAGPRRDRLSSSEAGLAVKAALTPGEQAADIADRNSPENLAELDRTIAAEKNLRARAILENERATLLAERDGQAVGAAPASKAAWLADVPYFPGSAAPTAAPKAVPKERSWGEAVTDTAKSAAAGVGGVLEGIGTVGGALTGNMDNTARETGKSVREYWKSRQSPALQAAEAARATYEPDESDEDASES